MAKKKKTKKDKVISDYRKKAQILETHQSRESAMVFVEDEKPVVRDTKGRGKKQVQKTHTMTSSEKSALDAQAKLIAGDLRKTVVYSVIGVGIIIVLYFVKPF